MVASQNSKILKQEWWVVFVLFTIGVFLRFWHITDNQFFFYDEGMYLGYNRQFLKLVASHPPHDLHELFLILGSMIKAALGTAKALWFFMLNLRVFIVGPEDWFFARLISAVSGLLTVALTYVLANRYFQCQRIAILSALVLMFLPSHVFYSRLGMQESLSTFLFLAAIYIFLFFRNYQATFLSALLLVCVFLTNYRMIISPIFLVAIELFEAYRVKRPVDWKRLLVGILSFGLIVFVVGSLYGGINHEVTFGWMSHQAQEAQGQRSLMNLFSYPYYTFALEGAFFALVFWFNSYFVVKKQWSKLLPFFLVVLQMGVFSLAAEKGVRYLCVVLPFMAIAAAVAADHMLSIKKYKTYFLAFLIGALIFMMIQSWRLTVSHTDYEKAIRWVQSHDPNAGILSTQPLVEQLYVDHEQKVQECPKNLADLISLYQKGYRYLIFDPQAYVSWTKDEQRFSFVLIDFLEFIITKTPVLVAFEHFNPILLERFVLDHNQNLPQSLRFLGYANEEGLNRIQIYDIGQSLLLMKKQAMEVSVAR
jgi:hypothetical protein